jgi:hypothetical protein
VESISKYLILYIAVYFHKCESLQSHNQKTKFFFNIHILIYKVLCKLCSINIMSFVFPQAEITDSIGGRGLSSRKPVRVATTFTGTLATAFADGQTIDSVVVATGDRILIKNQAAQTQNGVYTVQASGAPLRANDFGDGDAVASSFVYVQEGTVNGSTGWLCINLNGADIIGVDNINFKLISGDVSTSGVSTDNAIVRWDGLAGTKIQNSAIIIDDSNNITGLQYMQFNDIGAPANPAAGQGRLYKKTGDDGIWWKPDATGPEVDLTIGGSSGGNIIVQDEGASVAGTPHTTLNFIGSRITAANAGGGVANVTVAMPVTTKGDLFTYSTGDDRLPVGANNYLLTADSAQATGLRWTQAITPAQLPFNVVTDTIAADTDNYNPAGLSAAVQLRLTPSGATRSITGLVISGSTGAPNISELKITNVGTQFNIVLRSESASSTAANRFVFDGQDVVLLPGQNCTVWYDWIRARWSGVARSQDGRLGGQNATTGIISPAAISTIQDDYSPTGLENASVLRLTATAVTSITGITGGYAGRRLVMINIGTLPITLVNQSISSLSANRFFTGTSDTTIVGNNSASLIYDGISGFWRVYAGTGGAITGAGGLIQSKWVEVVIDRVTTSTAWTVYSSSINAAAVLPTGTITVLTTGTTAVTPTLPGSPASLAATITNPQTLIIQSTTNDAQIVTYTGSTGTTFTGCTGGSGAIAVGNYVWNGPVQTSVDAGSNGAILPQGTINVVSTTGFPASGIMLVTTTNGTQRVTYTGVTATTFTGCNGGTGTMSTGGAIYNISTVSPHDVLTMPITTSGGAMIIIATANASTDSNRTGYFHVLVDGFFRRGASTQGNGGAPAGSAVVSLKLSNVPAGDHVVTMRWVIEGGTFAIRPVTRSQDNNASLLVQEVSN